jgi:anti-anti-sigma factor
MATIDYSDEGALRRVCLGGDLDHGGCEDVGAAFGVAARSAPGDVIADLSAVTFAGSLAVRMLLWVNGVVRERGRRLIVAGPRPHVLAMLDRVGVLKVISHVAQAGRPRDRRPAG